MLKVIKVKNIVIDLNVEIKMINRLIHSTVISVILTTNGHQCVDAEMEL